MTYDRARHILMLRDGEPLTIETIDAAFRRRVKQIHPDTGTAGNGGPTVQMLTEARALLRHLMSDDCPACQGLTIVKALGSVRTCSMCNGTGRVKP